MDEELPNLDALADWLIERIEAQGEIIATVCGYGGIQFNRDECIKYRARFDALQMVLNKVRSLTARADDADDGQEGEG